MEAFIAQITLFGGNFAPRGWMFCQGQLLSIAQNTAVFSLLGTTFGGDGQTTFGLPDLRGRVAVGTGQGPGLSPYTLGEMSGTQTVTLLQTQMPAHNHTATFTASGGGGGGTAVTFNASNKAGTENIPGTNGANTLAAPTDSDTRATINAYVNDSAPTVPLVGISGGGGSGGGGTVTIGIAGGNQPFSILQPFLAMNYIICLQGIFPTRN